MLFFAAPNPPFNITVMAAPLYGNVVLQWNAPELGDVDAYDIMIEPAGPTFLQGVLFQGQNFF